jgi:predicted RNase H-like HicB family nuclease
MSTQYILTGYVDHAMAQAEYGKLEDGTFSGRIPACKGVVAFGVTLRQCQDELRSTLEDWVVVGPKLGHSLPALAGIDLNNEPTRESVDTM